MEHHIGDVPSLEAGTDVAALMQQRSLWWPFHRKPAQHERARCEANVLVRVLTPDANQFNDLRPFPGLSRNGKPEIRFLQKSAARFESRTE